MPKAHVLQRFMDEDQPGVWSVEVVDRFGDGEYEVTIFYGPYSEIRAWLSGSHSPSRSPRNELRYNALLQFEGF